MRFNYQERSSNPPSATLTGYGYGINDTKNFNNTLWRSNVRFNYQERSLKPPSATLTGYGF
ncbi:hypothetical protein F4X10_15205 [Candidatus Poribacteria bacterium]|nr:hypothetical protein [Candidatus Poribacteria bacterium]